MHKGRRRRGPAHRGTRRSGAGPSDAEGAAVLALRHWERNGSSETPPDAVRRGDPAAEGEGSNVAGRVRPQT
jgi:hypothetical protein